MKKYCGFLKRKIYLGVLIVFGMGLIGGVFGARKESMEPLIGVTQEDITISSQANGDMPELTGIVPLAAEQNKWYNFQYSFIFGMAGIVIYCILIAVYLRMYHMRFCQIIRHWLGAGDGRKDLFLDFSEGDDNISPKL